MRPVHFLDDLVVEALHGNEAGIHYALIEQILEHSTLECPENIAGSEVNPGGGGIRVGFYLVIIKFREAVSGL